MAAVRGPIWNSVAGTMTFAIKKAFKNEVTMGMIYGKLGQSLSQSALRLAPWGISGGLFAGWMILPIVKPTLLDMVGYEPPEPAKVQGTISESQFSFAKEEVGAVPEGSGGRWKPPASQEAMADAKLQKQIAQWAFSKDEVGAVPESEKA